MDLEELVDGRSFGALLFRLNPGIVTIYRGSADGDLEVLAVNEALSKRSGWTPSEVVGMRLDQLLHPSVVEAVMTHYVELGGPGDASRFVVSAEVPSGRRTYEVTMIRLEDQDGVPHCMTISTDVTESRDVAEALAETQKIAHVGHWSWDLESGDLRSTDEVRRMFGIAMDGTVLDVELFWGRVHPEDEPRLRAEIADELARDVDVEDHEDAGRGWESEFRVRGQGDEIRLIQGRGLAIRDAGGIPIRLAGTVQDITDRRAAEEAAHRAEQAAAQQRQALELNDDIVQGLATVRLALMSGEEELAMETLDRTIGAARSIISQLLAAKVEGGIRPGDMVRDRSTTTGELPLMGREPTGRSS